MIKVLSQHGLFTSCSLYVAITPSLVYILLPSLELSFEFKCCWQKISKFLTYFNCYLELQNRRDCASVLKQIPNTKGRDGVYTSTCIRIWNEEVGVLWHDYWRRSVHVFYSRFVRISNLTILRFPKLICYKHHEKVVAKVNILVYRTW